MQPLRVTPQELAALRHQLYLGHQQIDAGTARRLMDEIDRLRDQLAQARTTFASKAAAALEKRLQVVASFNHGGCPKCRDAEARAFLAKLRRIQQEPSPSPTDRHRT
jgi:hypothetical protein